NRAFLLAAAPGSTAGSRLSICCFPKVEQGKRVAGRGEATLPSSSGHDVSRSCPSVAEMFLHVIRPVRNTAMYPQRRANARGASAYLSSRLITTKSAYRLPNHDSIEPSYWHRVHCERCAAGGCRGA